MRRIAVVLGTLLVLVGTVAIVTYRVEGREARGTGLGLYQHRWLLMARLRAEAKPHVVWVGDSTVMAVDQYPSYIPMVQEQVSAPRQVPSLSLGGPGLDFYGYWNIAGRIAAFRPKLVVLIANLHNFAPERWGPGFNDLTAELELGDLPRTLALPYYIRGMTAPRLLLARALRTDLGEDLFLSFEGVRRRVQDGRAWDVLGPKVRPAKRGDIAARNNAMRERTLAEYDRPLVRKSPLVRFAGATVSRLAREGITVLVVVTPFAWERAVPKHYEAGRFAARIAMLRGVVEENGGHLLDLHRALTKEYFRDRDCHFTAAGAEEMAKLLAPEIRQHLRAYDIWAAATGRREEPPDEAPRGMTRHGRTIAEAPL